MTDPRLISIVICSLNGADRLPDCLQAVRGSDWTDLEVIVVDNGSTDGTGDVVRRLDPEAIVIRAERNLGFAGGNNLGIEQARGDMVVLLNDDCEPRPGWLGALVGGAADLANWGVLGCKLLYPGGRIIQHAGGWVQANGLTGHLGYGQEDRGQYAGPFSCDYVTGAAFAISRQALETVGLLDPEYFPIYFEELDYCRRLRQAGFGVYCVPEAEVIHHESQTTGRMSAGFLRKYHRNRLRFVLKMFSRQELARAGRAEITWLIRNRPWDVLLPLAWAYGRTALSAPALWQARRQTRRTGT